MAAAEAGARRPGRAATLATESLERIGLPGYLIGLVAAEAAALASGRLAGALAEGLLIAVLVNHQLLLERAPAGESPSQRAAREKAARAVGALSLVALLRLLGLTLPVGTVEPVIWYPMVGVPVLIALALALRSVYARERPRRAGVRLQLLIAASGFPLAIAGFFLLRPRPLVDGSSGIDVALAALVVFLFVGVVEELLFRGLLQRTLVDALGWVRRGGASRAARALGPRGELYVLYARGVGWATALSALTYAGTGSVAFVAFMTFVGLLFGCAYERTRSLVGVSLAHGVLSVGVLVVCPLVLEGV